MESRYQEQGQHWDKADLTSPHPSTPHEPGSGKGLVLSRRRMLGTMGIGGALAASGALTAGTFGVANAAQVPTAAPQLQPVISLPARKKTLIGIGYETWFMPGAVSWNLREATPTLGLYRSDDPKVIRQHAEWISQAGYDFIMADWSNN